MQALEVVTEFIKRINTRDLEGLCVLMTEDHVFQDALGNRVLGRETMRKGWQMYFQMVPDYRVRIDDFLQLDELFGVFGTASGTYARDGKVSPENFWEIPAAWKAVVRGGLVAEWHVYADNQPMRKLMGERVP